MLESTDNFIRNRPSGVNNNNKPFKKVTRTIRSHHNDATTGRGRLFRQKESDATKNALKLLLLTLSAASVVVAQTTITTTDNIVTPTPINAATSETTTLTDALTASSTIAPESTTTASDHGNDNRPTSEPNNSTKQTQANKLKPINFTLVDELFASTLDDGDDGDELIKRWRHMDTQFQEGIRSILKLIFPQIVAISQDAKVSGDCSGGILKWILSLRNLRSWAIKMLDATGKPSSGIFQGALTMMGNYGQCLSVRAPDEDEIEITDQFEEYFRGQYCVIHLKPYLPNKKPFYHLNSTIEPLLRRQYKYYEKTLYDELAEIAIAFQFIDLRLDLCVPSTCTRADIQRVAELLSKKLEFRAKVLRCDIEPRDATNSIGSLLINDYETQLWLALPLILFALVSVATIFLLVKQAGHSKRTATTFARLLRPLSLQASIARLSTKQTIPKPIDKPWPLYGLRSVFIIWFIIVQLTVQLKYQYLRESLVLRNMLLNYWPFQVIINTTMIFESIILITAFTYGYSNIQSTIGQLFKYIFKKYARIMPSIMTLVAVTIVTPSLGIISPVWRNFVDDQATICKSTGYLNLLFLQNFISYDKICIPHSWLLCVELQLIAISIPLVALFRRTFRHTEDSAIIACGKDNGCKDKCLISDNLTQLLKSKAGIISISCLIFGSGLNFFIVFTNKLPPTWFNTFPDPEQKNYYFGLYLAKTWTHLSTFIIGLMAGHLCQSTRELMKRRNETIQLELSSSLATTKDDSTSQDGTMKRNVSSDSMSSNQLASSASTISTITNESPGSSRGLVIALPQIQAGSSSETSSSPQNNAKSCNQKWCLTYLGSLACLLIIIFSTFSWSTKQLPSPLVSALFDPLSRLIWSSALASLMIKLCLPEPQSNKLTRLAEMLSCKSLIVLGRLSLLAYLWAPFVHTFVLAVQEQALFPSLYLIFHVIVGNIVITYAMSFIMSIFIEQPIRSAIDTLVDRVEIE